jgi:hypothetical protein
MGMLYRRGHVWWVKYYVNGRPTRESTGVAGDTDTAPAEARRFLKVREGKGAAGEPMLRGADRVRYDEIRTDLLQHYATTGRRNADELGWRLKHLDRFFGGRRVATITRAVVTEYVARRQEQGTANATINREPVTLGPMVRLAYRHDKANRLLLVERLKRAPRGPASSRRTSTEPWWVTYRPICKWSRPSPTGSGGGRAARSCRSSAGTWTWSRGR